MSGDELTELRERLRFAEAVRDDARAASARDLETRRAAQDEIKQLKKERQFFKEQSFPQRMLSVIGVTGSPNYLKRYWDIEPNTGFAVDPACGRCGLTNATTLAYEYPCLTPDETGQIWCQSDGKMHDANALPCVNCFVVVYRHCKCTQAEYSRWMAHLQHGVTPDDGDCQCRATHRQADCAAEGCGFCRAAEGNP